MKKNFENLQNPAMNFISQPQEQPKNDAAERNHPALIVERKHVKNKHIHMLMTASLYDELKEEAKNKGISLNSYMNAILENR